MDKEYVRDIRKCDVCGAENGSCIHKEDLMGKTLYCVCPSCYMWSDHIKAVTARHDKTFKSPAKGKVVNATKRGKK